MLVRHRFNVLRTVPTMGLQQCLTITVLVLEKNVGHMLLLTADT